jgi:hypothetical protein
MKVIEALSFLRLLLSEEALLVAEVFISAKGLKLFAMA